jgi:RNA polymerase sigma-70 factor (ECF subfamily)
MPFEEIAAILDRSPVATRQLASRARRRVQGTTALPDADLSRQQAVVDAFLAAAREGDFDGLLAVLDPEVVLRAEGGAVLDGARREVHGAAAVAGQALTYGRAARLQTQSALVNGAAGIVAWMPDGRPFAVLGFTVADGKIATIDILADQARLARLGLEPPRHDS